MSQQINLLNPAFHKAFDWLTAKPLAISACVMLAVLAAVGAWATFQANARESAANQRAELSKTAQDKLLALTKSVAESKPNAQLANELANAQALLKSREEIMRVLEGGAIGSTVGFADFLRGFARQTPSGLWLTGFSIGAGGNEMEIRGRMLNPASLPEYIRRLKTEKVFQGRSFASLTIVRPEEGKEKKIVAAPPASNVKPSAPAAGAPALPPSFVDFVLMPGRPDSTKPAAMVSADSPATQPNSAEAAGAVPSLINTVKTASDGLAGLQKPPEKKP